MHTSSFGRDRMVRHASNACGMVGAVEIVEMFDIEVLVDDYWTGSVSAGTRPMLRHPAGIFPSTIVLCDSG